MRIIKPSFEILNPDNLVNANRYCESIGRVCYKSENLITEDSADKFINGILKSGHETIIEHISVSVRFICDRGVSHECVRHRVASFSQASTRYCSYDKDKFGNEITVIKPLFWEEGSANWQIWKDQCELAEKAYMLLLKNKATAQEARSVLPHSLATELIMTANLREWLHFFKLRALGTTGKPHPQMLEIAVPLLKEFAKLNNVIFGDMANEC